jgi:hypothetical protein
MTITLNGTTGITNTGALSVTGITTLGALGSSVITSGTAQPSTSGTAVDFTSIPSWVKRVTVLMNDVSLTGTDYPLIRLGTASGILSTAVYFSMTSVITTASVASAVNFTTAFGIQSATASNSLNGQFIISNITGNTWVLSGTYTQNTSAMGFSTGRVTVPSVLTQLRITTSGTDTFDAGTINILYE